MSGEKPDGSAVAIKGDVVIGNGGVVDGDAVAVSCDIVLGKYGVIDEDVISFFGNIVVMKGARITSDAVSYGGKVILKSKGVVQGEKVIITKGSVPFIDSLYAAKFSIDINGKNAGMTMLDLISELIRNSHELKGEE